MRAKEFTPIEEDISRRGFLRGLGAAGVSAAAGSAFGKVLPTETVIVGPGDTIYSIARNLDTTPQEIYRLNGLNRDSKLEIDQKIKVPNPAFNADSTPHKKHTEIPKKSDHQPPSKGSNNALEEPDFMDKLKRVATALGVSPNALSGIIKHESRFKHHTPNPHSGAVGLIQFTPKTARQLGTTTQKLAKMTATQQLDYVYQFYKSVGVKPGMDIGDLYMLTFIPTYAGVKNPNVILGKKGGGILPGTDLSMNRIWAQNPVFSDGKPYFTIKDVKDRLEKFLS